MKINKLQKNIPESWQKVLLADVCKVNQGLQIPISERFAEPTKNRKVYITTQYLNGKSETEYIEDFSASVVCTKDEILMTRTGNSGIVVTGVEGVFHNNFFKVKPLKNINSKLLVYNLLSPYIQYKLLKLAGASTIPDLNHGDFYSIDLLLPPLPEQNRIVSVLETWDKAIENLNKKIEIKKQIKKGLMQDLLTGKKRLSGFKNKWEVVMLGDVCDIKTGKKDVNEGNLDGKYPFFTCAKEHTYSDNYSFDTEAILIAGNGEVGNCLYYKGKFEAYQRTYVLSNFKKESMYIYPYLNYFFQNIINSQKQMGAMPYIKLGMLQEFEIKIPKDLNEQKEIAGVLIIVDKEILELEKKLSIIKDQKKYLLNNLITGVIRTPENLSIK
jgi:type I restriction enzyme S subunit